MQTKFCILHSKRKMNSSENCQPNQNDFTCIMKKQQNYFSIELFSSFLFSTFLFSYRKAKHNLNQIVVLPSNKYFIDKVFSIASFHRKHHSTFIYLFFFFSNYSLISNVICHTFRKYPTYY